MIHKVNHVLAHSIGGSLIPRSIGVGLFGRQDLHKSTGEMIELVRLRDVAVQRSRIELRKEINPAQARVDAIGNGNIDKTILPRQWHGWLRSLFGQWEKSLALPTAHDH